MWMQGGKTMEREKEGSHLQAWKGVFIRNQIGQNPDLGLLASRTTKKQISIV
jgi:hypothetical protein